MNRIDRLFAITLLLQRQRRVRAQDLAKTFEVSERTIYRDVTALSESGVPIVALPGEGYELAEGFFLRPLLLSLDEARALFLGAQMLATNTTGRLPAAAELALAKVAAVLSREQRTEVERISEVLRFTAPPARFDLDEPRLATLQQAIHDAHMVHICYHAYNRNEVTERTLEPHHLWYFAGVWYVEGFCRLRQDIRAFRLDRIDALKVLKTRFVRRRVASIAPATIAAQIRFAPEVVRWVRERQHYGHVGDETASDGSVIMNYQLNDLAEIKPWLLSWGAAAEPLAPAELREMIRDEAHKLLEILT
jgi:predicted DNA-binding transcriptional regulator YafY